PNPTANTATVTSDQPDPNPDDNTDTVSVTPQRADLAVAKTVDKPQPNVGDTVTFTITVTNVGPDAATNVTVNDRLPAGVHFVAAAPSQGTFDPATGLWAVGTIPSGGQATLRLSVVVDRADRQAHVALLTGSGQYDPHPANNSAVEVVAGQQANLAVVKTVDNAVPTVGGTVTFTITLTNSGPSVATNVAVSDALPAGLMFVSAMASQGTYNSATGVWTVGTLAAGGQVTLTVTALVLSNTPQINVAVASAAQPDPDLGNNQSNVTVTPAAP